MTPTRTHTEALALAVNHCSTCLNFIDAKRITRIRCRRLSGCTKLWPKLKRALFACPHNPPKFGRDETIVQRFKEASDP